MPDLPLKITPKEVREVLDKWREAGLVEWHGNQMLATVTEAGKAATEIPG